MENQESEFRNQDSFTLIELLVVVAIIAVLVAVLLPALAAAREQGRSTTCRSQLRQSGMSFQMYADAYDGYVPAYVVRNPVTAPEACWYDILSMGGFPGRCHPLLRCPSNPYMWTAETQCTNYAQPHAVHFAFRTRGDPYWLRPYRLSEFRDPVHKVQLCDGFWYIIFATDYYLGINLTLYQVQTADVHNKGTNAVYADGHAHWEEYHDFVDPNEIAKWLPDR